MGVTAVAAPTKEEVYKAMHKVCMCVERRQKSPET